MINWRNHKYYFFFFFLQCSYISVVAEDDVTRLVTYAARINYFNRLCPQEKVYLHLDNTAYFQGETIWYAANVVDATTGGEAASKVLYVELLSPTGVVLKQQKLKITDGRCHGSFSLIDNAIEDAVKMRGAVLYPSGYYQLRAYTRTMLNFDDAGVFSRVIPVYKAPDKEGDYAEPTMDKYTYNEYDRPELKHPERPKELNVSFFPEGGHLISGLPCRVAFKATDKQGHGVSIDGLADDNDVLYSVPFQHNGMGYLEFTPGVKTQKVQTIYEGKKYTFSLPTPEREGCTLRLGRTDSGDSLTARFAAAGNPATKLLGYTLTSQGKCHVVDTLTIGLRGCTRTIATTSLPTGVYQLTLFDADGAVYAQRLLFIDNGIPTEAVSVTAEKADIHPFDEIRLNLQSVPQSSFSLAVRDAADYGTAYRDDIRTYMLLSSELKGLIEEPGWYFEAESRQSDSLQLGIRNEELGIIPADGDDSAPSNPSPITSNPIPNSSFLIPNSSDRKAALDLLMMVQGWTRYNWQQMAGVEPFKIRHYTEEGLVLDGWAFSRYKEVPLANVKVGINLYSPDRDKKQSTIVTTDSLGYWSVGVEDFEGEWDLFIQTRQQEKGKENNTTRMRLERSFSPQLYAYQPIEKYIPGYIWNATDIGDLHSEEEDEDDAFVAPSDAHLLEEVEVHGRRMYIDYCTFKAFDADKDTELILDDGLYTYKVADYLRDKGYTVITPNGESFPSVGINGIHTEWIIIRGRWSISERVFGYGWEIDMEKVKTVIVYDKRKDFAAIPVVRSHLDAIQIEQKIRDYHGGPYVVEIRLHNKSTRKISTKNSRHTSFSGYTPVVEFYAPTYPNGPIQGDKDYRRTIYWNPEVTTDADGHATVSFYNNGYSRALTVSAEGITTDGVPIINQ